MGTHLHRREEVGVSIGLASLQQLFPCVSHAPVVGIEDVVRRVVVDHPAVTRHHAPLAVCNTGGNDTRAEQ